MMRFFNLGTIKRSRNNAVEYGFNLNNSRVILYHEVITDMTLWTMPPVPSYFEDDNNNKRIENAYRSAAYVLKKAMVKVLHLTERDIGVVVRRGIPSDTGLPNGCKWTVIFYDLAQGGGGAILPIIRQAQGSEEKIKEIVQVAIGLCKHQDCIDDDNGCEHPEYKPVDRAEWINAVRVENTENLREAHACKRCVIGVDNRFEEGLDRLDALAVLNAIVSTQGNGSMASTASSMSDNKSVEESETLAKILDKLIAHPNRNAKDVDKKFIQDFRECIANDNMILPAKDKEFICGQKKTKALISWEDKKIAIFLSEKDSDVKDIKPSYDGWELIVISAQIDITDLKNKVKEV
jgi:hypothetical protein